MEAAAYYCRMPVYHSMELANEFWFGPPVSPTPYYREPSTFEKIQFYTAVLFYVTISPFSFLLWGNAIVLDSISNSYNNRHYTYLQGTGRAKTTIKTMMTWNVCMFFGGLCIPFGGMAPSSQRISYVAREILSYSPDLVCLQEVSQDAAYELYEELQFAYRFFYIKINPDPCLTLDSGLFVASKVPLSDPQVLPLPCANSLHRAAFSFRSEDACFITTHMHTGSSPEDIALRRKQAKMIINSNNLSKCIILGDFNMSREEYNWSAFRVLNDALPLDSGPTYVNFACNIYPSFDEDDQPDHIASTHNVTLIARMGQAFNPERTYAISDHNPLIGEIVGDL